MVKITFFRIIFFDNVAKSNIGLRKVIKVFQCRRSCVGILLRYAKRGVREVVVQYVYLLQDTCDGRQMTCALYTYRRDDISETDVRDSTFQNVYNRRVRL